MTELILSSEQAQAILNFLTNCPYGQVHELVSFLVNAKTVEKEIEESE